MSNDFLCYSVGRAVGKDCRNLEDSYGEICVYCNCCGRFGRRTMYTARIRVYRRFLREEKGKAGDRKHYPSDLQQENIQANIRCWRAAVANAAKCEKARKARLQP